jgi:hypothetical protein
VIAAARQGDNVNPQKASSGSQFYIVQGKIFTDSALDVLEDYTIEMAKKFLPIKEKCIRPSVAHHILMIITPFLVK